ADSSVTVIDAASGRRLTSFAVGSRPRFVVFTHDGVRAYVSAENGGTVTYVDARADTIEGAVVIGDRTTKPTGLASSPDEEPMLWRALLGLVPVSVALAAFSAVPRALVFVAAILAIIPLAEWVRRATEQVAARAGSTIGGLMNVSFGNAPELILALFVLHGGHVDVVKAQITGSLIGNSLLGLGLAIVAGSFGRDVQHFNRDRAGLLSSLLILVTIAVLLPALFDYTERGVLRNPNSAALDERLSLGVAIVLILVYIGNLVYTLVTHRAVFARTPTP